MSTITKGSFSLDIAFVKLGVDLSDDDRQCAWELYTEIATRVAVVGKRHDTSCRDFDGELLSESITSLHTFFLESRGIMRKFPVGRIKDGRQIHLGILINRILAKVIRPFLEKWSVSYRCWSLCNAKDNSSFEDPKRFPRFDELVEDWSALRQIMRDVESKLADQYELVPLETKPAK